MKRRDVFKGMMIPLAVMLAVVLSGCGGDPDPIENPISQAVVQGVSIGANGGVVTAMAGNIVITIPAGALSAPASFTVEEMVNKAAGNYALKTIVIQPLVEFSKPVQIALRYDGCLDNGVNVCEARSVMFSIWDNETAFMEMIPPKVCSGCTVNPDSHTVCMCICQTGVIATTADL